MEERIGTREASPTRSPRSPEPSGPGCRTACPRDAGPRRSGERARLRDRWFPRVGRVGVSRSCRASARDRLRSQMARQQVSAVKKQSQPVVYGRPTSRACESTTRIRGGARSRRDVRLGRIHTHDRVDATQRLAVLVGPAHNRRERTMRPAWDREETVSQWMVAVSRLSTFRKVPAVRAEVAR